MPKLCLIPVSAILLFCTMIVHSQERVPARALDSLFNNWEARNQAMGSISISRNGEEVYHKSVGPADREYHVQPTARTKYRIGSVTKTFTAVVILQLIDEKRLRLNSGLSDFFPKIPYATGITVGQLLHHNSGLTDKDYLRWKYYGKSFKRGKKAEYANVNYVLLGEIAEKVAQKPLAVLMAERIFQPCGLANTYYGNAPDSIRDEARSYIHPPRWEPVPSNDLNNSAGAGAVVSTPTDVNLFLEHLFSGTLLSAEALRTMTTIESGYGCGLMQNYFMDKPAYSHSGAVDGFQSTALYFPKEKLAVTYLANGVGIPINEVLIGVLKIYFGVPDAKNRKRP